MDFFLLFKIFSSYVFGPKQCFLSLFCHLPPTLLLLSKVAVHLSPLALVMIFILTDHFLSSFFSVYAKLLRPFPNLQ